MRLQHQIKKLKTKENQETNISQSSANVVLTTLVVLGDAPWCMRAWTMFSWPMKAATWMGVRPDCRHTNTVIWADQATRRPNREREAKRRERAEPPSRPGWTLRVWAGAPSPWLCSSCRRCEAAWNRSAHTHTQGERVRIVSSSEAALPAVTQGLWLAPRPLIGGWRGSEWFGRKWKGGAETRQRQTTRANILCFLHCGCLKGFFKNPLNDDSLVATSFKPCTVLLLTITLYRLARFASLMFGNFLFSQKMNHCSSETVFLLFFPAHME